MIMGYADTILSTACQISGNEHIDRSTLGLHLRSILSKYSSSFACKLVALGPSFFCESIPPYYEEPHPIGIYHDRIQSLRTRYRPL